MSETLSTIGTMIGSDIKKLRIEKANRTEISNTAKTNTNNVFTVTQQSVITPITTGDFDIAITNNFNCTLTTSSKLNFINLENGRSGIILFENTFGNIVSKADNILTEEEFLTDINKGGKFLLKYITDGTNVFLIHSKALI